MAKILPPCNNKCPLQTDVRGYLAAIAQREYAEAYRLIRAGNPFPSVCAWICPAPCEEACRRAGVDAPLAIKDLKRFVVEQAGTFDRETVCFADTGKKIAIAGAGPAGLTAAHDLVCRGHRVVVYERRRLPGGQLSASVPAYRLPAEMLERDLNEIFSTGVEVRCGVEIGRDITIDRLQKEYDAVIVSTGLWAGRRINLPGFDRFGVYPVLPFLQKAKLGKSPGIGHQVIVVGGGDVAMDAARTALRLGASGVRVVCLEPEDRMPAHRREINEAVAEGVIILPGFGPVEVFTAGERIGGLMVQKVKSVFDRDGSFEPVYEADSFMKVPGDTVLLAIGQVPDNVFLERSGLETNPAGCLVVDRQSLTTSTDGVFACGEIAEGPGAAVAAIASGHRAAAVVESYLIGAKFETDKEKVVIGPIPPETLEKIPHRGRRGAHASPPVDRVKHFEPYETGFNARDAFYEAGRCLGCGLGAQVDQEKCVACLTCLRVCPYQVPVVGENDRAVIPVENCQACGTCAACCPAGAITFGLLDEARLDELLEVSLLKHNIAVFACGGLWIEDLHREDKKRLSPGLPRKRLVRVPTADALRLEWILKAFESGAAGVAVLACGENQCRYLGGRGVLEGVVSRARNLLRFIGIAPERFYYCRPGAGEDPVAMLDVFAHRIRA